MKVVWQKPRGRGRDSASAASEDSLLLQFAASSVSNQSGAPRGNFTEGDDEDSVDAEGKGMRELLRACAHPMLLHHNFKSPESDEVENASRNKLVTKQVLNEPYRPVTYSLTERGRRLAELVVELEKV